MRLLIVSTLLLLLTGCVSKRERFYRDMRQHYDVQFGRYYSIYASSDIEGAKKALNDIIALSLAEKSKAKYYWPFDTDIAFAQARLAVIAEKQGNKQQAERLFASASDYLKRGEEANDKEVLVGTTIEETSKLKRFTPAEWRKAIRKLDTQNHVKWDSPNTSLEPTPTAP